MVEAQGNYPNSKQKIAEKEDFVITKVDESQPLFSKCRLRAARFKVDNWAINKEIRIWKRKLFPKSHVFSINFSQKLQLKIFPSTPR